MTFHIMGPLYGVMMPYPNTFLPLQEYQRKVKEIKVARNPPVTAVSLRVLLNSPQRSLSVCRLQAFLSEAMLSHAIPYPSSRQPSDIPVCPLL